MSQTKASHYLGGADLHSGLILPSLPDRLAHLNKDQERVFITWRVNTIKRRLVRVTLPDFIHSTFSSSMKQLIGSAAGIT